MKEEHQFFGFEGSPLFGVFHLPSEKEIKNTVENKGMVFCPPFGDERQRSHRVYVNFARKLCLEGFPVLRFDYRGDGDSRGELSQVTIKTGIEDITEAISTLRKRSGVERIGLLGLRFGGTLASLVASKDPQVNFMALWAPIVDSAKYIQEYLRANLVTQMVLYGKIKSTRQELTESLEKGGKVNVEGYEITGEFYREAKEINLLNETKNYARKILIVDISRKDLIDPALNDLSSAYKNEKKMCELVHLPEDSFWNDKRFYNPDQKELFELTLNWLKKD